MTATLQDITLPGIVRTLVNARDRGTCLGCGRTGETTVMPRTPDPLDDPAGWVTLCGTPGKPGTCAWKAAECSDESRFRGYVLDEDEDPAEVPVMVFAAGEDGFTEWLARDGRYDFGEDL